MQLEGDGRKMGNHLVGDQHQADWGVRGSGRPDAERAAAQADGRRLRVGGGHYGANDGPPGGPVPPRDCQRLHPPVEGDSDPSDKLLATAHFSLV